MADFREVRHSWSDAAKALIGATLSVTMVAGGVPVTAFATSDGVDDNGTMVVVGGDDGTSADGNETVAQQAGDGNDTVVVDGGDDGNGTVVVDGEEEDDEDDELLVQSDEPEGGLGLRSVGGGDDGLSVQSTVAPSYNTFYYDLGKNDSPRKSAVFVTSGGRIERVEYVNGELVVNEVTRSGNTYAVTSSGAGTIDPSTYLPTGLTSTEDMKWGGVYHGNSYNFVVTGQTNGAHDDDCPVIRISKYDFNWRFIGAAEFKDGVNAPITHASGQGAVGNGTVSPFLESNVDFCEVGGKLHVRTSHLMYTGHQASMQIVVNESNMEIVDSMSYVLNVSQSAYGYVSHAFANQLTALGSDVYAVSLGDGSPRSLALKKIGGEYSALQRVGTARYANDNYTHVTMGGLESSSSAETILATFTSGDPDNYKATRSYSSRDVYIVARDANLGGVSRIRLSNYGEGNSVGAGIPKLVKVNENLFCAMWSEVETEETDLASGFAGDYNWSRQTGKVSYVFVNGFGEPVSNVVSVSDMYLSDCDPVVDGQRIIWAVETAVKDHTPKVVSIPVVTTGSADVVRDLSGGSMGALPNVEYDGASHNPHPAITFGGKTLVEGTDYVMSWSYDGVQPGTVQVTATGMGKYQGVLSGSFRVTKKVSTASLSTSSISGTLGSTFRAGTNYRVVNVPSGAKLSYKSGNTGVVTVDANGVVSCVGAGTATIQVTVSETAMTQAKTLRLNVTVKRKPNSISGTDAVRVPLGKTVTLGAKATSGARLTYRSSKPGIAVVNSNGVVTPVATGTTYIYASAPATDVYQAALALIKVTVTPRVSPKRATTINAANKSVVVGKTVSIGATATAGAGKLSYSSSNKGVCTVNASGVVTGVKAGTSTITIHAPESTTNLAATKRITVTVTAPAKKANPMTASGSTKTVAYSKVKGKAQTLTAITVKNAQGNVTYSKSSGSGALSVNSSSGKVTVKKGTKKGTYKATVKVNVAGNSSYKEKTSSVTVTVKVS